MEALISVGDQYLHPAKRRVAAVGSMDLHSGPAHSSSFALHPQPTCCMRRLRLSLLQTPPSSKEKIDRQPLVWNGQVMDSTRQQLGERSHIAWEWARGPACSLRVWRDLQAFGDGDTCGSGRRGSWCSGEADRDRRGDSRRLPPMALERIPGDER